MSGPLFHISLFHHTFTPLIITLHTITLSHHPSSHLHTITTPTLTHHHPITPPTITPSHHPPLHLHTITTPTLTHHPTIAPPTITALHHHTPTSSHNTITSHHLPITSHITRPTSPHYLEEFRLLRHVGLGKRQITRERKL